MPYDKPTAVATKWNTKEWQKSTLSDQTGRVICITGTTSGTGYVAAQVLAELGGTVLLLNRQSERSAKSLADLQKLVPDGKFEAITCDLQDLSSVRQAAQDIKDKYEAIHTLCLNAGIMATLDVATVDGYNAEVQTNVIAQVLLFKELYPLLVAGSNSGTDARIVFHSSIARYGGPLKQKYFEKHATGKLGGNGNRFQNMLFMGPRWARYHQTKLAAPVLAYYIGEQIKKKGLADKIKISCAHPGLATTQLQVTTQKSKGMPLAGDRLMSNGQSQEDGALGIIRCMADPSAKNQSFFGPGKSQSAMKGMAVSIEYRKEETNPKQGEMLWTTLQKEIGEIPL